MGDTVIILDFCRNADEYVRPSIVSSTWLASTSRYLHIVLHFFSRTSSSPSSLPLPDERPECEFTSLNDRI